SEAKFVNEIFSTTPLVAVTITLPGSQAISPSKLFPSTVRIRPEAANELTTKANIKHQALNKESLWRRQQSEAQKLLELWAWDFGVWCLVLGASFKPFKNFDRCLILLPPTAGKVVCNDKASPESSCKHS